MQQLTVLIDRLDHPPAHSGGLKQLARDTDIAYSTIRRIRDRDIKNPGIETVGRLLAATEKWPRN